MAEQEEKKDVFNLDGIEHEVDSLEEEGRFLIGQLNSLNRDKMELLAKLDIVKTAEDGYISRLRSVLQAEEEVE